jgi:tetratricopeptide (TPR) repeat protein
MRFLAALTLAGAAATSHAEPVQQQSEARARFTSGRAHYDAGNFEHALSEFLAGYTAWPAPSFLVNVAQCLRRLDRLDEAAGAYQRYLAARIGDADVRQEVTEARDEVIGELDGRMYRLAESVAQFDAFLKSGEGSHELRDAVSRTRREVLRTLVKLDDRLEIEVGDARRSLSQRRELPGMYAMRRVIRRSSP